MKVGESGAAGVTVESNGCQVIAEEAAVVEETLDPEPPRAGRCTKEAESV